MKELRAGFHETLSIIPRSWISKGTRMYRESVQEASDGSGQRPRGPTLRQWQGNKKRFDTQKLPVEGKRKTTWGETEGKGKKVTQLFGQMDLKHWIPCSGPLYGMGTRSH